MLRLAVLATMFAAAGAPAATTVRVAPATRATTHRPAGLRLVYAVPEGLAVRRATVTLRVTRRTPALSAFRAGRKGAPVRGRRRGRRITFDVTSRVRSGRRLRLLVTARDGRDWTVPRGRPRLVLRLAPGEPESPPAAGPPAPPSPEPTASPGPSPEPTASPSATPSPSPSPAPASTVFAGGDIACSPTDPDYNDGAGTGTNCRQLATSDLMFGQPADAVLALGDLQYETGSLAEFNASYGPSWGRLKGITRPAAGNHEYETAGAAGYFDYFNGPGSQAGPAGDRNEGWYSFDVGTWHIVVLNSNCTIVGCAAGSPQETWLRADLAAHPAACTLAFFHHPLFSSDSSVGGSPSVRPLWTALYDAGADLILNGHAHVYERFAPQAPDGTADPDRGIRQFTVGSAGRSLHGLLRRLDNSEAFDDTSLGVLRLTLSEGGYAWAFLPAVGSFSDSGTGDCR